MNFACRHCVFMVLLFATVYARGASPESALKSPSPVGQARLTEDSSTQINASGFSITDTVDQTVIGPGGKLNFTITVANAGSAAATGVLTDSMVRGSILSCHVSNGDSCQILHAGIATVNFTPFAPGETRTITISAAAANTAGDYNEVTNTATLDSGSPLQQVASASVSVTVRETADITVSSSLVDSTNGVLHYVHTVTNTGPNNAHAVLLLDPLPANTVFIRATTTQGKCSLHSTIGPFGSVRCPLNNPGAGRSIQVDVVLQAFAASCPSVTNTTTITSQNIDTNSGNNSAIVVTKLPPSVCAPVIPPSPTYQVSLFDGNDIRFSATQLNNNGDLLGLRLPVGPFIYKNGASSPTFLPIYYPYAFNDLDDVAGETFDGKVFTTGVYKDRSFHPLDFGAQFANNDLIAINNNDQIAGYTTLSNGTRAAFVYQNGVTRGIGDFLPTSMNSKGEITGILDAPTDQAVLYSHSLLFNLATDYATSYASGVDSSGRVTGFVYNEGSQPRHIFIYSGGKVQDLGPAGGAGGAFAAGINDCGEVAGFDEFNNSAFLYTHGGFVDLNAAISLPENTFLQPMAINNKGQIFGITFDPYLGGTGTALLTPTVLEKCGSDATIDNNPDSATVTAGQDITYTIVVKNLDTDIAQFNVSDELDATTTLISCAVNGGQGSCNVTPGSHTLSISLPALTKGSDATITVKVAAASAYPANSLIMNTATVSSAATADYLSTAYTSVP